MRRGLGVLDQRRPAVDARLERARGASPSAAPGRRSGTGRSPPPGRERTPSGSSTASILHAPVEPARGAVLDRRAQRVARMARGGGVDDDRLAGAELAGERDRTVDHEVREVAQEELVLAARRLALGRVHDDDRPTAALGDGPDLAGGRKACAAAAGKPARLELAEQLAPLELERARDAQGARARAASAAVSSPREEPRRPGREMLERGAHTWLPWSVPLSAVELVRELEDERERERCVRRRR